MKYFVILLILIGLIIPQAFGVSEEIIHGRSSFELLPSEIIPDKPISFEIVFMYYDHPYSIESLLPIIEINPSSARPNVHIDVKPINVYPGQIFRIPVTMTADSEIEHEKIFLSLSFMGNDSKTGVIYKSGWNDSAIIDIQENLSGGHLDKIVFSMPSPLKQFKSGISNYKIQCRDNLQLILKTSNNSPTGVTPETKAKLMQRDWGIEPMFNGLTKPQVTDIQLAKFGCKKIGNQTYCDTMVQEKIEYYVQQNKLGIKPEPTPGPEPSPEPALMSESETIQRQQQAKLHVQEVIMTDYRDPQYHIRAINDYRSEFESRYFLEQFIFSNKQNYEKDDLINFIFVEWGYQPQKCTSSKVEVYLRHYDNYDKIEKISEWQKPKDSCFSIDSDSNGYLIMNLVNMSGTFEPHETCTIPGEYRIVASNLEDESKKEFEYYTCQKEKIVGLPQPWMELPE